MAVAGDTIRLADPAIRETRLISALRRAVREPLLHFLVIGAAIFAAADLRGGSDDQHRIVLDKARVAQLSRTYAQQFGGAPTPAMLRTLIANDIDEEILYREGLAMGLDRGDEVIRRRVVQKVQFLEQDLGAPAAPGDAALLAFYETHPALYTAPARVSFTHIYFSPDRGGEAQAKARALATLSSLGTATTRAPEHGDAYPDLYDYSSIAPDDAARLFGTSEIAHAIFTAPLHHWAGPFRSGYGWHLIYVSAVEPSHLLTFAQARDAVRTDELADAQTARNDRNFTALKSRYTIVREDRP
jgi:peptidyl-prolyl cis-trans isomerase C